MDQARTEIDGSSSSTSLIDAATCDDGIKVNTRNGGADKGTNGPTARTDGTAATKSRTTDGGTDGTVD